MYPLEPRTSKVRFKQHFKQLNLIHFKILMKKHQNYEIT